MRTLLPLFLTAPLFLAAPPEKDKLPTATLAIIKQWIEGGLKACATGNPKKATSSLDILAEVISGGRAS